MTAETGTPNSGAGTIRRPVDRVDVHAHFVPDFYREALIAAGRGNPDGMPFIPPWDAATALAVTTSAG